MFSPTAKLLVLVCCLPLALPQGWCCMVPRLGPANACPVTGARCCCPEQTHEHPSPSPTPERSPKRPGECPCADRNATAPDALKDFSPDLALAACACVCELPSRLPGETASLPGGDPDWGGPPLHLLNCVWLC